MQKALFLPLLLIIPICASALYDSQYTVDSKGAGLCMAADGFTALSCNETQYVALDGTRDHVVYILPYTDAPANDSINANMRYFSDKGIKLTLAFASVAALLFMALAGLWIYQEFFLKGVKRGF